MNKTLKFHISKRASLPWYKSWAIRGIAILAALVVCAIVTMLMTGENPISIYSTIFYGAFGTTRRSWVTIQELAVLLGISLAVTPAFKMRFWNIGAEGQVLMGCLVSAGCMMHIADSVSPFILIVIMFVSSVLAGALWAIIPAIFKAKWNTNETLFTLMLNYVATQIVAYFCIEWAPSNGSNVVGVINFKLKTENGGRYGWHTKSSLCAAARWAGE